jgi:hypothetical protein
MSDSDKTGLHIDHDLFNVRPGRYIHIEDVERMVTEAHLCGVEAQRLRIPFKETRTAARLRAMMGE